MPSPFPGVDPYLEDQGYWREVHTKLLSPSNKRAPGAQLYDEKRQELIDQNVHLVELDLLIEGERLPMVEPLPEGHFYAFVSRSERRPKSETYVWTIRDRLPGIPVPLKEPDADLTLDLGTILAACYERARWGASIRYGKPLRLPLSPEDREWAESLARAAAH